MRRKLKMSFIALSKRCVWMLAIVCSGIVAQEPQNQSVESLLKLNGVLTQGGLVVGKTTAKSTVTLNGIRVTVSPSGHYLLGFGRDAKLENVLVIETESGKKQSFPLKLKKQEYKIERIDGLPSNKVTPRKPEELERIAKEVSLVKAARNTLSTREDYLDQIIWPAKGRLSGFYGSQRILNGVPKRPHYGLDIANKTGTQVVAPWSGRVILVHEDMFFTGGTLIIDHGFGLTSTYIHLSKLHVKEGDEVARGQLIAEIGMTGRATGPHLDWRINLGQERLDPYLLVKETP